MRIKGWKRIKDRVAAAGLVMCSLRIFRVLRVGRYQVLVLKGPGPELGKYLKKDRDALYHDVINNPELLKSEVRATELLGPA